MMLPKINSYNDTPDKDLDVLAEFISYPDNYYGAGMDNLSIAYVNRECAIKGECSFIDPYYVNGDTNRLRTQLVGQRNKNYLITSSIYVYGTNNAPNEDLDNIFKNTLGAIHNLDVLYNIKFDKIFMPIGCKENNKPGHNIALILENNNGDYRATVLDQLGLNDYRNTKYKMLKQMESLGICDIDMNRESLTDINRMDCASVTSLLRDYTLKGEDMRLIKDLFDSDTSTKFSKKAVDEQHQKDKDLAIDCCIRLGNDILKACTYVPIGNRLITKTEDLVLACINKHKRNNSSNYGNTTIVKKDRNR